MSMIIKKSAATLKKQQAKSQALTLAPGRWVVCLTYSIGVSATLARFAEECCYVPFVGGVLRKRYRGVLFCMDLSVPLHVDALTYIFDMYATYARFVGRNRELDIDIPLDVVQLGWTRFDHYSYLQAMHLVPRWTLSLAEVLFKEVGHSRFVEPFSAILSTQEGLCGITGMLGCGKMHKTPIELRFKNRVMKPERIELGYVTELHQFRALYTQVI